MKVKIKLIKDGEMPKYKTSGASCMDCYARIESHNPVEIKPYETKLIPLGFCVELPEGYEMQIRPRSGLSCKGLVAEIGTIDSDYRGEVGAIMNNRSSHSMFVIDGDRICQAKIVKAERIELEQVGELSNTERGVNGFGSTGLK